MAAPEQSSAAAAESAAEAPMPAAAPEAAVASMGAAGAVVSVVGDEAEVSSLCLPLAELTGGCVLDPFELVLAASRVDDAQGRETTRPEKRIAAAPAVHEVSIGVLERSPPPHTTSLSSLRLAATCPRDVQGA